MAYESPGGMPTATAHGVDLVQVAKGCGIKKGFTVASIEDFREKIKLFAEEELCFIVAKIETGTIERPPYASLDYKFNKYLFATYIEETEKRPVLRLSSKSPFTS
jgi:thiamine pyrophosphate-dependent acetolactate synthase large subunit-like protein